MGEASTQIGNGSVLGNNRERYEAVKCVALWEEGTIAEKKKEEYAIPLREALAGRRRYGINAYATGKPGPPSE